MRAFTNRGSFRAMAVGEDKFATSQRESDNKPVVKIESTQIEDGNGTWNSVNLSLHHGSLSIRLRQMAEGSEGMDIEVDVTLTPRELQRLATSALHSMNVLTDYNDDELKEFMEERSRRAEAGLPYHG